MLRQEQWDGFLRDVASGLSITDAAVNNRISRVAVYDKKDADKEFSNQLEQALIKPKSDALGLVKKASKTVWTAAAWLLERKWPDEFGLKQKLEYTIDKVIVSIIGVLNTRIPERCPHCQGKLNFKGDIVKELEFMEQDKGKKGDKSNSNSE